MPAPLSTLLGLSWSNDWANKKITQQNSRYNDLQRPQPEVKALKPGSNPGYLFGNSRILRALHAHHQLENTGIKGVDSDIAFQNRILAPRDILFSTFRVDRTKSPTQPSNKDTADLIDSKSNLSTLDVDNGNKADSSLDEHKEDTHNASRLRKDLSSGLNTSAEKGKKNCEIPNSPESLKLDIEVALNEPADDGVNALDQCFTKIFQQRRNKAAIQHGALPALGDETSRIKETMLLQDLNDVTAPEQLHHTSLLNLSSRACNGVDKWSKYDPDPELHLLKRNNQSAYHASKSTATVVGSDDEICFEPSSAETEGGRSIGLVAGSKKPISYATTQEHNTNDTQGVRISSQKPNQTPSKVFSKSPTPLNGRPTNTYPTPPSSRKVTPDNVSIMRDLPKGDPTYQYPASVFSQMPKEQGKDISAMKVLVPEIIPSGTHGMMSRLLVENNRLEGRAAVLKATNLELNRTLEKLDEKNEKHMAKVSALFANPSDLQAMVDDLQDLTGELQEQVYYLKSENEASAKNEEKSKKDRAAFLNLYKGQLSKVKFLKEDVDQWKTKYWALSEHLEQIEREKKRFHRLYETKVSKANALKEDRDQWQTKYWALNDANKTLEKEILELRKLVKA